jgi:hypothetical protein
MLWSLILFILVHFLALLRNFISSGFNMILFPLLDNQISILYMKRDK